MDNLILREIFNCQVQLTKAKLLDSLQDASYVVIRAIDEKIDIGRVTKVAVIGDSERTHNYEAHFKSA